MESLIPVINDLQKVFLTTGMNSIELPQIAVVGSQSCGKSSVLESLVKKSFLPRGSGIVTRCPVILQLKHTEEEEFCEFLKHDDENNQETFDFNEARDEIERLTDEMAGSNKGISMDPIIIQVHSPNVIDLTVVDLPGIVKVPVGDQPDDIEEQVRKLILKYIKNPQAIILAVSPANADIATSESIKLAREVDPEGNRTLGVITKLDLMDKGTDANAVLEGKTIKLKLGMVGVVNRSQQDINDNKTIEEALKYEDSYIAENYPNHKDYMGSQYLAKRLQRLLMEHIHKTLPDLKKRIGSLTDKYEAQLETLGTAIDNSPMSKMLLMMETIHEFLEKLKNSVKERQDITADEQDLFAVSIAKVFEELDDSMKDNSKYLQYLKPRIAKAMKNSVNFEGFASIEDVFKCLVKQEIKLFEQPAVQCCHKLHAILERVVDSHLKDGRFERLNNVIFQASRRVLSSQLKVAKNAIIEHLTIESEMIFSSDPEFARLLKVKVDSNQSIEFGFVETLPGVKSSAIASPVAFPLTAVVNGDVGDDEESVKVRYVECLITSYCNVIRRQVTDFFPKSIMHHLYATSINGKIKEAIKAACQEKESELVVEPEDIFRQRIEAESMLGNLDKASEIICGIYL